LCCTSAYIITLGRKRLKHISGTIIYDSRITSDGETRVARDHGTYSRYLYLPRVSDLYELKSRSLFIIYRAIASLIKPNTLPVIKSVRIHRISTKNCLEMAHFDTYILYLLFSVFNSNSLNRCGFPNSGNWTPIQTKENT